MTNEYAVAWNPDGLMPCRTRAGAEERVRAWAQLPGVRIVVRTVTDWQDEPRCPTVDAKARDHYFPPHLHGAPADEARDPADYGSPDDQGADPETTLCRRCGRPAIEHSRGRFSIYGTCPDSPQTVTFNESLLDGADPYEREFAE